MAEFVHLHLHSEYSLLDGACRIADIPKRAKSLGQKSVAITDHGVLYGAIAFYDACKKEGIKPIIGCEVYVAIGSRFEKKVREEGNYHHLVLLCKNEIGYHNLCKMVSLGFTEGFYSRPRIDENLLAEHHEGLIALSACIAGKIPKELLGGDFAKAEETALKYQQIFGKENFYIELQNHGLVEEKEVLPRLVALAEKCQIPLVATNDCHYTFPEDAETQAVLKCIQTQTTLDEGRPSAFATDEFYMKSTEEMARLFSAHPEALENTVKIAEQCAFDFDYSTTYLPKFPCPNGLSSEEYLKQLTKKGYEERIQKGHITFQNHPQSEYDERLAYETDVILKMGYADYFLIVQDYVNFARSRDIPVGPGRGSGAGSLVAFALGITDIDPLPYDLLFERFLNPERVSMPDIDMDFCYNRRDEVIAYTVEKYGRNHVSQVITFGTLAARAAVRDVGRVMGLSYAETDEIAKAIPRELGITLADAQKNADFKKVIEENENARRLINIASKLEGMPRNVSVHAAGIIITDKPVTDYVPVSVSGETVITQYDKDEVAHLGLLKFDFLALRNLTILRDAEKQIQETNRDFDIHKIDMKDAKTYQLISSGKTAGVFQLESNGIKNVLQNLKPDCLDDIIAVLALYRPGPMDSIPTFIKCRHNPSEVRYALPELEPILSSTYGCIVYQEQVMQIFRDLAGYTFGHADIVRRAMAKKKADALLSEEEDFLNGCQSKGIEKEKAKKLFDDMQSFANYAFNKSHAAAYAVLSYQTAYCKCHYPQAYFSALLTSVMGDRAKVAEYISECAGRGIGVLPPDINHSRMTFVSEGKNIRFGLLAIKGIGEACLKALLQERKNGPFKNFTDFIERMPTAELNKRMVESLIKAGALDCLGDTRATLLACYEILIEKKQNDSKNGLDGQMSFFTDFGFSDETTLFDYDKRPEYSKRELLTMEKDATGLTFSGSMLDDYKKHISHINPISISYYLDEENPPEDKTPAVLVGLATNIKERVTKKGARMMTFTLEDRMGEIECLVFPRQMSKCEDIITTDRAVCIKGTISIREEEAPKVLVEDAEMLMTDDAFVPPVAEEKVEGKVLYLRFENAFSPLYNNALSLCEKNKEANGLLLRLYFADTKKTQEAPYQVCKNKSFIEKLSSLLGEENVVIK